MVKLFWIKLFVHKTRWDMIFIIRLFYLAQWGFVSWYIVHLVQCLFSKWELSLSFPSRLIILASFSYETILVRILDLFGSELETGALGFLHRWRWGIVGLDFVDWLFWECLKTWRLGLSGFMIILSKELERGSRFSVQSLRIDFVLNLSRFLGM